MEDSEHLDKQLYTLDELENNLHDIIPDIPMALEKPIVENPFKLELKHRFEFSVKSILGTILAIVRLVQVFLVFVISNLVCRVVLLGHRDENPAVEMTGYRKKGQDLVWKLNRGITFAAGYYNVPIIGKYAGREKAPILVIAPHSTYIDDFILGAIGNNSCVSRIENASMYLSGAITRALHPLYIDRTIPNSRLKCIKEIKRRALDNNYRPMFIFPEGTTTNRKAIIAFKHGAFYPGVPVQPVVIRYLDKENYNSWTWDGPKFIRILLAVGSRLQSKAQIEFLPVYVPSKEEKEDPFLYARNVRKVIADHMSLPVTDHSYEDCLLMMEALKHGIPSEAGLIEYYKMSPLLGLKIPSMLEQFRRFAKINTSRTGVISFSEFSEFLNLPRNELTRKMFNIYDVNDEDGIRFREYLIGTCLIAQRFNQDVFRKKYFETMTKEEEDDKLTLQLFLSTFHESICNSDQESMKSIFDKIERKKTDHVSFNEFDDFCQKFPEYSILFMHYIKLAIMEKLKK